MRRQVIAANWKMNKVADEVEGFFEELASRQWSDGVECVIFPQALLAAAVSSQVRKWSDDRGFLSWGVQNVSAHPAGAFTGENSVAAAKSLGARWVLIGHSERRTLFGETDEILTQKVKLAEAQGLQVMLCVGETRAEREGGQTLSVVERQLKVALAGFEEVSSLAVAYEPVWAIGTGLAATGDQAQEVHAFIRQLLTKILGTTGGDVPILYGGSVKPENAKAFLGQPDVDGLLVGGASLEAASFAALVP